MFSLGFEAGSNQAIPASMPAQPQAKREGKQRASPAEWMVRYARAKLPSAIRWARKTDRSYESSDRVEFRKAPHSTP
jgi:hypothetical protein